MPDQKMPSPETPTIKEIEQLEKEAEFERENEGLEVIEPGAKTAEALRARVEKSFPEASEKEPDKKSIGNGIEEKIETIVNNFVKSAAAAEFDEGKVDQIIGKARMYIAKGYPQIADEVHDRILEAKNKGMH
ncbi:MAG TPA: hypothetical protein PK429_00750 [Candidatus Pacearchaeota archaeon]|nr:hypothetical protein [Candidatus Pacearchaeota archaeon]